VREALATLSERCQALLQALYYEQEEPDYRRVAEQLGMPLGSVGPTRGRCLERLLEALDSRDDGAGADVVSHVSGDVVRACPV
jgi:DNA-directed RNA polymerase specialized sigma24 family protein